MSSILSCYAFFKSFELVNREEYETDQVENYYGQTLPKAIKGNTKQSKDYELPTNAKWTQKHRKISKP